jgi:shikimate kinase
MSKREARAGDNLLSAFALTIGGALGVGLPMTLVIIWLCS